MKRQGTNYWIGAFFLLGLLALTFDITHFFTQGFWQASSLGDILYKLSPATLNLAQAIAERYIHPLLWDPLAIFLLTRPNWLLCFVLAAIPLLTRQFSKRK